MSVLHFFNVPSGSKGDVMSVKLSTFQDQLNTGFWKVCETCKVCGVYSLKCVQKIYTQVC